MLHRPGHGGHRVGTHLVLIGVGIQVAGHGHIVPHGVRVAVEDGGQLLPGHIGVGAEGGVRGAVDHPHHIAPDHRVVVIGAHVQVLKVGGDRHLGAACRPVQNRHQLAHD